MYVVALLSRMQIRVVPFRRPGGALGSVLGAAQDRESDVKVVRAADVASLMNISNGPLGCVSDGVVDLGQR
jgi:hypothetical protein